VPRAAKPRTRKPAPKAKPPVAAASGFPAGAIVPDDPSKEAFVRGLVERGEAARPGPSGALPRGATHEIIGVSASGLPIVVRRRFSGSPPR
jgi:hypothetical protein